MIKYIYVDDLFNGCDSLEQAYIDTTLAKYGFAIKGWTYTGQPDSPDDSVRDANKMVQTGGSLYCPKRDTWTYKFTKMHNGIKSRG